MGGVESLSREWPAPDLHAISRIVAQHDRALCLRAAREAREIVQAQDRAPNITRLFELKLER